MNRDLEIQITFPVKPGLKPSIKTNAKPEAVSEILTTWVRQQPTNRLSDTSAASVRDEYRVSIYVDLTEDWLVEDSNTGNRDLTAGIVLETLRDLAQVSIAPLEQ